MIATARRFMLHVGNFIVQYHFYIVAYVTSAFLAKFIGVQYVGYAFVASSVLVALLLYAAPPIYRAFGTRNVMTVVGVAEVLALLGLSLASEPWTAVILVTLQSALAYMLFIGMDLLIEASIVRESVTGSTRTAHLTFINTAVFVASLTISALLTGDQYQAAFVTSAIVLIVFLVYAFTWFPSVSFAERAEPEGSVLTKFKTDPSVRKITLAHLLLQVFFSWMSVYIPILLFLFEGFTWGQIGLILAIAMLPYIFLEYPLGYIADKWLGEKEILIVGYVIIAGALFAIPFLPMQAFWWWAGVMFVSRIGAAMVESMTEVHFFRHVSEKDTSVITTFRELRPLGSIIGPLVASLTLLFLPLPHAFALFGAVMLLGIPVSLSLVDTK
jgi:MFS family permease